MPLKPKRPCNAPGCPALTDHPRGYCERHLPQKYREEDSRRGTSTKRGYDGHWRKIRKFKLQRDPLCQDCLPKVIKAADLVHHIDRDTSNNEDSNLRSLCEACHDKEHKEEVFKPKPTGRSTAQGDSVGDMGAKSLGN